MNTDQRYGPQTEQVEELLVAIRDLTDDQQSALRVAVYLPDVARNVARDALWDAARGRFARLGDGMWDALRDEVLDALRWLFGLPTRNAVWDTLRALIARDKIGNTFTQEHYDLLTTPWRTTIGSIHPDDANLLKVGDMS